MVVEEMDAKKIRMEEQEFNMICGSILRSALAVEDTLDFFFMQYFIRPQCSRSFFFRDEVLTNMNFSAKIRLFDAICKELEIDTKTLHEICQNINFIKEKRDIVAHRPELMYYKEEGFKLHTKKITRFKRKEDEIKLTKELAQEIADKTGETRANIIKIMRDFNEFERKLEGRAYI